MSRYRVVCKGNTRFDVYERKSFLFISWWSFMCKETTVDSAKRLIENLYAINNTKEEVEFCYGYLGGIIAKHLIELGYKK